MEWRLIARWSLLIPNFGCGVLCALAAYGWAGTPGLVAAAASSCLVTASMAACLIAQRRAARTALNRADFRGGDDHHLGWFAPLVDDAELRLAKIQSELQQADRNRTELDAKLRVKQRQARLFESALELVEIPVVIADRFGEAQILNAAAKQVFPRSGTDEPATDAIRPLLEQSRSRAAASPRRTAEITLNVGGESIPFEAVATNIQDADGSLLGTVALLRDVRSRQVENARHAEFVSSVCHELKTPMAGIKAFTEMLLDGECDDPQEQRQLLSFIDLQVDRLTRLANNMLNLSRIESGVVKVQRIDCDLNAVVQKAIDVVAPTAHEKDIRLLPELSELYLAVSVDPDLFSQAIINVLSNAVKYTRGGGEVRVRSRMSENGAVVEIADNGVGIPEDALPRIFERFFRVPQNEKVAMGTGLGLSLVHYIVTELHNGRITVTSTVDAGSCFTMTVPLGHQAGTRRLEPALCAR